MTEIIFSYALCMAGVIVADAFVRPTASGARLGLRDAWGIWVILLFASAMFSVVFALSGNATLSAIATTTLHAVVAIASNAKRRVLGEPLLFSDLALVGAMFKHPQFYFSVLALWQQVLGVGIVLALAATLAVFFSPSLRAAGLGAGAALISSGLLLASLKLLALGEAARTPDADRDVRKFGLVTTLSLYWMRWREARADLVRKSARPEVKAPQTALTPRGIDDLIIVVQCESFADPADLFEDAAEPLPHLSRAKSEGVQWGHLNVSGFGAYTMRTEFGVLFGREEEALGFLLYDPYLTALDDPAPALPQKLEPGRWDSLFVHPHDMRFYARDQILPKAGFDQLVGEDQFAEPDRSHGRYVRDGEVASKILKLAEDARRPSLIYAVTMENHGPWAPRGDASVASMVENYDRLVRAGDAMLGQLLDGLADIGKPTTLVFFGDHRPTIPGASEPGGEKHTPYVIVQLGHDDTGGKSARQRAARRSDLTPAQLHQAILDCAAG